MKNASPRIVLCNGANLPKQWSQFEPLVLEYQESAGSSPNVKLALPDFVRGVFHLPNRILDLLEIAAYVFCADRGFLVEIKPAWSTMAGHDYFTLSLKFGISIFGAHPLSKKNSKTH